MSHILLGRLIFFVVVFCFCSFTHPAGTHLARKFLAFRKTTKSRIYPSLVFRKQRLGLVCVGQVYGFCRRVVTGSFILSF